MKRRITVTSSDDLYTRAAELAEVKGGESGAGGNGDRGALSAWYGATDGPNWDRSVNGFTDLERRTWSWRSESPGCCEAPAH